VSWPNAQNRCSHQIRVCAYFQKLRELVSHFTPAS